MKLDIDLDITHIPDPHVLRYRHELFIRECLNGDHGEDAQETMKLLEATIESLTRELEEAERKIDRAIF